MSIAMNACHREMREFSPMAKANKARGGRPPIAQLEAFGRAFAAQLARSTFETKTEFLRELERIYGRRDSCALVNLASDAF